MDIVTYKTAFYSFYLPVACGLHLAGMATKDALATAERILVKMGQYFQIQVGLLSAGLCKEYACRRLIAGISRLYRAASPTIVLYVNSNEQTISGNPTMYA